LHFKFESACSIKKWLWILVIALPILAAFETIATVRSVDVAHQVVSPRHVDATESALAQLDSKALAKLSASLLNDHKTMSDWWRWAQNAYEMMLYLLLGVVFLFAAILAAVLWRMPSNPALKNGAAKSGCPLS